MGKWQKGTHGESTAHLKHSSLPDDPSNLHNMLQNSSVFSGWMNNLSGGVTGEWEFTGIGKTSLK